MLHYTVIYCCEILLRDNCLQWSSYKGFQWVVEEEVVKSVLANSIYQTWEDLPLKMQAFHNQSEEHDNEDR